MLASPLLLFFVASAILNLTLAIYGWRHRHLPGAIAFSVAILLFAAVPLSQAINIASSDFAVKVIALKSRVEPTGIGAAAWLVMIMQFSGYSHLVNRRLLLALSIVPTSILILNWTENPLFRSGYYLDLVNGAPALHWTNGPIFWVGLVYLNALLLTPLYLLWRSYGRISHLSFRQTLALSISILLPLIFNALSQFGVSPIRGINFPFAAGPVMGLIVAWAILRYHIFDLVPIARGLLIDSMSDGVLVLDTQSRIVDMNPAMKQLIGPAAIGQNTESTFAAWPKLIARFRNVTETRTEIFIDGDTPEYFDLRISPLTDRHGRATGKLIVVRDITRHKQTEIALRTSEDNFRRMLESAPDAMLIVDQIGSITFANTQSEKLFGYSHTELLGQSVEKLLPEKLREIHEVHRAEYRRNPKPRSMGADAKWELSARRKNGNEFPVEISLSPLESEAGMFSMAAVRDITERKRMEDQLRLQSVALESAANAIVITDLRGFIQWVNSAFTNLTGYTPEDSIGQSTQILRSGRHGAEFYEVLWNTIQSGSVWDGEIINRRKDGHEYLEHQTITPVRNKQGVITNFIAIKQDITERKRAEIELQTALKRTELLYDITSAAISSENLEGLLHEIVHHVALGLPADRVSLIIMDLPSGKVNRFIGGGNHSNQIYANVSFDELMDGLSGWAIRNRQSTVSPKGIPDLRESPTVQKRRLETNCGSILVTPLLYRDQILGTLTAINLPEEQDFTEKDVDLLEAVASQIGSVIDKITLEEDLQLKNAYLEALHQITLDLLNQRDVDDLLNAIITDATRLLDAPFADLDIVEEDTMVTRAFTENQSFERGFRTPRGAGGVASWRAYDTQAPVIINDYASWPERNPAFEGMPIHATIVMPLISNNYCLGVFSLSRSEMDHPFTSDEIRIAALFAQQAALALDNANLHTQAHHEIDTRKATEETLRAQNNYLAALHEITLGLINRLDPDLILESILTHLTGLMNTPHALVDILDPQESVLVQKVAVGRYVSQIGFRIARGEGFTGRVWEREAAIVIPDYSVWDGSLPEFRWIRTVAGFPMRVKGKVIGVISVAFDTPDRTFTAQDIDLLQRFANLASVVLDNAQLFSEAIRQSQELSLLHEVRSAIAQEFDLTRIATRTVEAIAETFGYTLVSLYMLERDTFILQHQVGYDQVIREIPITKGVLGRVFQTGKPILLDDVHNDPAFLGAIDGIVSEVAVPIFDNGRVAGILNIESKHDVLLTESDMRLMIALSQQISVAVGRARLYEALQIKNERLSMLHQITIDLLKERNMNDLLQAVVDQASKLLDADIGYLSLKEGELLVDRAFAPVDAAYQKTSGKREDDKSPTWRVLDSGEPFITPDYSSTPGLRQQTAAMGVKACMLLPLFSTETIQGVIGAGRIQSPVPFNQEEIQLGSLFARLVGLTIDNAELHETLRQESIRDSLTGLFNRRFMEESLAKELIRAARITSPLAVVMLDLDHFKSINDTFGHDGGDKVLRRISLLLKASVRESDIICRYGGEEFTLILPNASLADAHQRMEQLRNDIKSLNLEHRGKPMPQFTGSFGIGMFPEHGTTSETLLKVADEALYRAKKSGRDRIVTA